MTAIEEYRQVLAATEAIFRRNEAMRSAMAAVIALGRGRMLSQREAPQFTAQELRAVAIWGEEPDLDVYEQILTACHAERPSRLPD